jgi:hypothetical protein
MSLRLLAQGSEEVHFTRNPRERKGLSKTSPISNFALGQQIRQDPEDATLYCRRGHAYAEQGKRKEAAADFAEFFRRTAPVLP